MIGQRVTASDAGGFYLEMKRSTAKRLLFWLGAVVAAHVVIIAVWTWTAWHYDPGAGIAPVSSDIDCLTNALKMYKINAGRYPTTEQGLDALVHEPTVEPLPVHYMSLMDEVPRDPWGNPYGYRCHGPPINDFEILCAGKDGVFGTDDDFSSFD